MTDRVWLPLKGNEGHHCLNGGEDIWVRANGVEILSWPVQSGLTQVFWHHDCLDGGKGRIEGVTHFVCGCPEWALEPCKIDPNTAHGSFALGVAAYLTPYSGYNGQQPYTPPEPEPEIEDMTREQLIEKIESLEERLLEEMEENDR